nr:MAG TPA: hypothetical protein [Caudoviricetes sp.]
MNLLPSKTLASSLVKVTFVQILKNLLKTLEVVSNNFAPS